MAFSSLFDARTRSRTPDSEKSEKRPGKPSERYRGGRQPEQVAREEGEAGGCG
jgi:hypothetical protein